jgi:hypothetical protein
MIINQAVSSGSSQQLGGRGKKVMSLRPVWAIPQQRKTNDNDNNNNKSSILIYPFLLIPYIYKLI